MSDRITDAQLEAQVRVLNARLSRPAEPYTGRGGTFRANVGNIHLSHAYGGVQVVEMVGESGGVHPLTDYHAPKRSAYEALRGMHAILDSIERSKGA